MAIYRGKSGEAARATRAGIVPALLRWRTQMGFPHLNLAATEIIDGEYIHGTFEQGGNTVKKPEKNVPVTHEVPHYTPASPADYGHIKVTHRRKPRF